ncbi:MAG: Asp-tRNA(Asn)/Glu-tRNA(Gln) amidotransferase subunit GatB [Patescibacteria group bacterium]
MPSSYKATIGLEVHAELKTKSKMFCGCKNDPDEKRPNLNICPVCMAHPGALPVINKEAVKNVIKVGLALGGNISSFTEFDRKNYFYPDIPKGYQISQYKYPLVSGGSLNGIKITRVHLEEDTARSSHDRGDYSLIDYNRAGVPLMELVTEPVIENAEDAGAFARELQLVLRTLGVSDANMEKGEMRVEANISVSDDKEMGTKVEVKNLNSFKSVERAIAYEVNRHIKEIISGGKIVQETRGWDEEKEETFSQRLKESSHDYRYFPDPDLPKLDLGKMKEFSKEKLSKELPELPWEKRNRLKGYGLEEKIAEIFVENAKLGRIFEEGIKNRDKGLIRPMAGILTSIPAEAIADTARDPSYLGDLVEMQVSGSISSTVAKTILPVMFKENRHPREIASEKGLLQKNDEAWLNVIAKKVIENNQKAVSEYKSGKESSLKFLIGQGMKESGGAANPQALSLVIEKLLK